MVGDKVGMGGVYEVFLKNYGKSNIYVHMRTGSGYLVLYLRLCTKLERRGDSPHTPLHRCDLSLLKTSSRWRSPTEVVCVRIW